MNNKSIKVLLVDDEPDILDILKYNFKKENYIVYIANNGLEGLEVAKKITPHVIILDVMMPKIDGIETCRLLREIVELEKTVILFLTARSEDYSEIAGFNVGADDYVTKPIRPRSLLARVNSLLKQKKINTKKENIIKLNELIINTEKRLILKNNLEIFLPKKEYQLLLLLASKPGKVFSRDEIYKKIWGATIIVGERTLDVHIRKLRKKIGDEYIRTSKGFGYSINNNL